MRPIYEPKGAAESVDYWRPPSYPHTSPHGIQGRSRIGRWSRWSI